MLVQYLQWFAGLCWAVVAVRMAKPAWRCVFGPHRFLDPLFSVFFYFGLLQAGFVLRWAMYHATISLMQPAEVHLWTALYALCATLAVWALVVAGEYRDRSR